MFTLAKRMPVIQLRKDFSSSQQKHLISLNSLAFRGYKEKKRNFPFRPTDSVTVHL
jgi:hypothetical protein